MANIWQNAFVFIVSYLLHTIAR